MLCWRTLKHWQQVNPLDNADGNECLTVMDVNIGYASLMAMAIHVPVEALKDKNIF